MLRITESNTKYRKRDKKVCYIDPVNQHLADARQSALGYKDEVPITSEKVLIHLRKEFHPRIRALLRNHKDLWSGQLGHIHGTSHQIDLVPETRTFKSGPYRAGPK